MPSFHTLSHAKPATDRFGCSSQVLPFPEDSDAELEAVLGVIDDPDHTPWSEEELDWLHCLLLKKAEVLANPEAPLADVFEVLRWVFTEPDKDGKPFSFTRCLSVARYSKWSPFPDLTGINLETLRTLIRGNLRRWLKALLAKYPDWVRDVVQKNPLWIALRLDTDAQWINKQLRLMNVQSDLFA